MKVQVKSSNGITIVPVESCLFTSRKIFIEGEIDHSTASEFVKEVTWLNNEDNKKPIDVLIDTPGGNINAGMVIYDVIQGSQAPIRLFCIGRAYSMGAVLMASGNHGRYVLPHSELMLHEPLLGSQVSGNSSSIKSISDSLLETRKKMNQILAKHTGKTVKAIEKATEYDHYFSSEESIEFGLCDEIVEFSRILEE